MQFDDETSAVQKSKKSLPFFESVSVIGMIVVFFMPFALHAAIHCLQNLRVIGTFSVPVAVINPIVR